MQSANPSAGNSTSAAGTPDEGALLTCQEKKTGIRSDLPAAPGSWPIEQKTMRPSGYGEEEEEERDASAAFCLVALITTVTKQYSTAGAVAAG